MADRRAAEVIESRYGPLGCGGEAVTIREAVYSISDLLIRMGLNFDDSRPIDALVLGVNRYVFRYYDGQDQRVVAIEFDADFRNLGEVRAQFPEWVGDEESYPQYCGH